MDDYNYNVDNEDSAKHSKEPVPGNRKASCQIPPSPTYKVNDSLAIWSTITGILAIFLSLTVFLGFIGGVISLVLAILSRNKRGKFEGASVAGLCCAITAILLSLVFFAVILAVISNPDMLQQVEEMATQYGY